MNKTLSTLEDQIKAEWGVVRAFIALHPLTACIIALVAGGAAGRLL